MKEYIKKFESLNDADNHVIDNPFTSYIVGQGNLVCGEPNKKLKLEGGSIVIADAPVLYTLTWEENGNDAVGRESEYDRLYWGDNRPTQAEAGETISVTYMGEKATVQIWINDECYEEVGPDSEMRTLTFTMPAENTTVNLIGMNVD